MTLLCMIGRAAMSCLALLLLCVSPATAEQPRMTPDAAYRELARTGFLANVIVDGDIDVARLEAPVGRNRIELRSVQLHGTLTLQGDGPALALSIDSSTLRGLDLSAARLRASFELENSEVLGLAHFDATRFEGPFSLHASWFLGSATFRSARFDGPVEIAFATFPVPPGTTGAVSFEGAQFAAPARFDHSRFDGGVHFDAARFTADASFLGLVAAGDSSWRNVLFARDAEFRFCSLGDAYFGDPEHMSVFAGLADFRGCTLRSARFDYVDWRGDAMLVNVRVAGDLSLCEAALRGDRSDFSGLKVDGRLVLVGAHITSLHFRWPEIAAPLLRAEPPSDVLRPLQSRLEALKQDDDAREAFAVLAEQQVREELARPDLDLLEKARLWLERVVWGWPTGYGTRLGRIAVLSLAAWLLLSLPLLMSRQLRVATLVGPLDTAPPRHCPVPGQFGTPVSAGRLRRLAYCFGLMFATPGFRLRPSAGVSQHMLTYLLALRGVGGLLLALLALTLAKVSPIIQAILGRLVG